MIGNQCKICKIYDDVFDAEYLYEIFAILQDNYSTGLIIQQIETHGLMEKRAHINYLDQKYFLDNQ